MPESGGRKATVDLPKRIPMSAVTFPVKAAVVAQDVAVDASSPKVRNNGFRYGKDFISLIRIDF